MKHIISMVVAGMLGGLIMLGGISYSGILNNDPPQIVSQTTESSPRAQFTSNQIVAGAPFDFVDAAKKTMPAVVHIKAKQTKAPSNDDEGDDFFKGFFGDNFNLGGLGLKEGSGSGVIITDDGYIITNNHVIDFADEIEVTLADNRKFEATLIGTDKYTDLAVLKIEGTGLPILEPGNSDDILIGEWVMAVGNPLNLTSTVTAGIVSAKGRNINLLEDRSSIEAFIQTDAAVNPGNSGGALVDLEGKLVGINTAIASRTGMFAGYSFAIPVNIVSKVVDDIIKYGSAKRGYLGVNILDLDADLAKELGLDITKGVYVDNLAEKGSAIKAGVLPGDVIVGVDNDPVESAPQLQEKIGRLRPGDDVKLEINRGGKTIEIPVRLKEASTGG